MIKQHGRITNYEIAPVRGFPYPKRVRWRQMWSSLSDLFHPKSQAEWEAYQAQRKSSEESS